MWKWFSNASKEFWKFLNSEVVTKKVDIVKSQQNAIYNNSSSALEELKKLRQQEDALKLEAQTQFLREQTIAKEREHEMRLREEIEQREKLIAKKEAEVAQREKEEKALTRLELERQHKLNEFPLEAHLEAFINRLDDLDLGCLNGATHTKFLVLHQKLNAKFESLGLVSPVKLETVSADVHRINQIEVVINLYGEKIKRVKLDETIDEDEKATRIEYWTRLRDKHVAEIAEGRTNG